MPLSEAAPEPPSMRRRVLLGLLILAGFVVAGVAGVGAYFLPAIRTGLSSTGQAAGLPSATPTANAGTGSVAAAPTSDPGGNAPFTVLLLGSDNDAKFSSEHVLTQSMILVRVEPATKHVTMLSIPRDLYVRIPCGYTNKIDAAYSYGGAACAVATVEQDFHVHIDHYVWIGLKGLVTLIDQLGGVDVVTTNPVIDDYYPADLIPGGNPYAFQRVAVLPGAQHLDGLHAMEYVRSRHGDLRSDFGRSERQQEVLLALRAKARSLSVFDLPDIASSLNGQLATDMGIREVADLLPLAAGLDLKDVDRVVLTGNYTSGTVINGADVLLPNWDLILPLVRQSFPS